MRTLSTLTLVTVALVVALGCAEEAPPAETPLRPVRTEAVTSSSGPQERTFAGTIQAGEQARLSFRVSGTVSELEVAVGDAVAAGDLIAAIDCTDYELAVREARGAIAQVRAQQRQAEAAYRRTQAMYESQTASAQDLEAARTARDATSAQLGSLSQRAQMAQRQVEMCRLTAPTDGTVSAVSIEAGENVGPGAVVAVLQAGEQLEVRTPVPSNLIERVDPGLEVRVVPDGHTGEPLTATVTEVGVQAEGSAVFPVVARFPEGELAGVRAGMAADVTFVLAADEDAPDTVVPSWAVGEDRQGRYVWVAEPGEGDTGTVHRRAVEIGRLTGEGVEIRSGLEDGERIVVAGVSQMRDGLEVRLPGAPESAEATDAH